MYTDCIHILKHTILTYDIVYNVWGLKIRSLLRWIKDCEAFLWSQPHRNIGLVKAFDPILSLNEAFAIVHLGLVGGTLDVILQSHQEKRVAGPERFFSDITTYTGVHRQGFCPKFELLPFQRLNLLIEQSDDLDRSFSGLILCFEGVREWR